MTTGKSAPRRLSIFGSTGSVGRNTLNVVDHLGGRENFEISVLTGNGNVELLARQARSVGARLAVTASDHHYESLKSELSGSGIAVAAGKSGLMEAADREADWVMAAIVGTAGLAPTLAAARRGADIALANKECLVCAGDFFMQRAAKAGACILPADSEHNALFQALSIEIFRPIDQLGWARAVSTVTLAISSSDDRRKGPPDAVRMIRSTAWRWFSSRT